MSKHGGYRRPTNPAAVSGPGALSRRTDGQPKMALPDAQYGEQASFNEAQSGAQVGGAPAPLAAASAGGGGMPSPTPLDAPSARPEEPVTAGSPMGPGVGPESLGLATSPEVEQEEDLQKLRAYMPALMEMANRPETTASFRNYVRVLRTKMGG